MADYDIFREQLSIKYSSYGHALWEPSPAKPNNPVKVGDVGFIRDGAFHRLFNVLHSVEDQSDNVPEYFEQLVPKFPNHIRMGTLSSNHYCSDGVSVKLEPNVFALGPDDFEEVSFSSSRRRGAVLSLPVDARREDTLAKGDFSGWIVKHIDRWFTFARGLGLGIERMEEIILASFGVNVVRGPAISINWRPFPERVQGAVLHRGPDGTNLPEDQCVFIRGFRVARTFWMLPKHLKAAAGPSPDIGGYDCEPHSQVVSIPATPEDPLHLLQDYVADRASDCDMVLVHDDDLVTIDELSHGASPETLQPDMMMDLLRRSNIEIHKVSYDLSQTNSGPNTERSVVKVAMLSMTSQSWNTPSPSQWSPLSTQTNDLGYTSESKDASTSSLPGSLPVPMIRGESTNRETSLENHSDNVPFTRQDLADSVFCRVWQATEDIFLALGKIEMSPSVVWPSLNKFAHMERKRLLTAVVVTCCAVLLLGWAFSFTTWDVFKISFTILLATLPLSIWFERETRYRHQLDDMYERLEALQHQVSSMQLNPTVPDVMADVRYSLPIIARTIPANPEMLVQAPRSKNADALSELRTDTDVVTDSSAEPEPSSATRRKKALARVLFGGSDSDLSLTSPFPLPTDEPNTGSYLPAERPPKVESSSSALSLRETLLPASPSVNADVLTSLSSSTEQPNKQQELAKEVQRKADAVLADLNGMPSNAEAHDTSQRRRVERGQISGPRLVYASTSVDTFPVRSPPALSGQLSAVQNQSPTSNKFVTRFKKIRKSLTAKPTIPASDGSTQYPAELPSSSGDRLLASTPDGLSPFSAAEPSRPELAIASPAATVATTGSDLKGFVSRFLTPRSRETADSERRKQWPLSSAVDEGALKRFVDAANNLGLDQDALAELLARSTSVGSRPTTQNPKHLSTASVDRSGHGKGDPPLSGPVPLSAVRSSAHSSLVQQPQRPSGEIIEKAPIRRRNATTSEAANSTIVRRTLIFPSEATQARQATPEPLRRTSTRRRRSTSAASIPSNRYLHDRVPTPPPPKSSTARRFSAEQSPPMPHIPSSLMAQTEAVNAPQSAPAIPLKNSNSAYDSLYEMYTGDVKPAISVTADVQPPDTPASSSNPGMPHNLEPGTAVEVLELANGETVWSIVNGPWDDDEESFYGNRAGFVSDYSLGDEGVQVKEHGRTGSKDSQSSFLSRKKATQAAKRPDTKVFFSSPAQIGRLIDNISHGADSGSFHILPSANDAISFQPDPPHSTVEERLEHMLNTLASA